MARQYLLVELSDKEFILLWVTQNNKTNDLVVGSILNPNNEADRQWVGEVSKDCFLKLERAVYYWRLNSGSFFGKFKTRNWRLKPGDILSMGDKRFSSRIVF